MVAAVNDQFGLNVTDDKRGRCNSGVASNRVRVFTYPRRRLVAKSVMADIPVMFGGVSIGKSTAKLSLKVNRVQMSIEHAEELFCERRLSGLLQLGGAMTDLGN